MATANKEVMDRIRKLIRLANNNTHEGEIQAANDKIAKLLKEYNLSIADVHLEKKQEWDIGTATTPEKSQHNKYEQILSAAVARLLGVKNFVTHGSRMPSGYRKVIMNFVGEATDIAVACEVWPWLCEKAVSLARQGIGKGWTPNHRAFAEGFSLRVYERAKEINAANKKPLESDGRYAIVLADKSYAVERYVSENLQLKKYKGRGMANTGSEAAFKSGMKAGDTVNLNFRNNISAGASNGSKGQIRG